MRCGAEAPVDFLSIWTVLGRARSGYTAFITDAAGKVVNVRTPDGTYLTQPAARCCDSRCWISSGPSCTFVLP